tara:strand:+ start:9 stop:1283 length:1275 start_codon:yes stop_codon:yes gene_type:complete
MIKIDNIILGAGLTGLSAAYSLKKNYLLFEKNSIVGGLTSSEKIKNYYFDHTGHWLHLNNKISKIFVKKIMKNNLLKVKRNSKILFNDDYGDYPFQYNLSAYNKDFIFKCVSSLFNIKKNTKPKNFTEFCYANFGKEISDAFMLPYNLKLWGKSGQNISFKWCNKFFPKPDFTKIINGAFTKKDYKGYNHTFFYPKKRGIGEFSQKISQKLNHKKIIINSNVQYIDLKKKKIRINDKEYIYKNLISTIPLPDIISLIKKLPKNIIESKRKLKCTKLRYINYGIKKKVMNNVQWVYIPNKEIPFYRIGCSSNAVSSLAPNGCSSVFLEISNNNNYSEKEILKKARKFLIEKKIIKSVKDIVVEEFREMKYGYVIFDKNYDVSRNICLKFLEKNKIYSIGRYGSWIYSSMEDAILAGLNTKKMISV